MTLDCASVRERLADLDGDDVHAAEIDGHVAGCAACRDVQRSLVELDLGLASLGTLEPPSVLVERTLAAIEQTAPESSSSALPERVGLLAILGAVLGGVRRGLGTILGLLVAPFAAALRALGSPRPAKGTGTRRWAPLASVVAAACAVTLVVLGGTTALLVGSERDAPAASLDPAGQQMWLFDGRRDRSRGERSQRRVAGNGRDAHRNAESRDRATTEAAATQPVVRARPTIEDPASFEERNEEVERDRLRLDVGVHAAGAGGGAVAGPSPVDRLSTVSGDEDGARDFFAQLGTDSQAADATLSSLSWRDAAANPFADRGRFQGLSLQDAHGYWANTYVPGDPVLRSVYGRLVALRGAALTADGRSGLALAEHVSTTEQPFDAPTRAALGLYVHADRSAIESAGRVLLQVGIRASARAPGQRPALGVAIVLDLRQPFTPELWTRVQALLESASRARQADDRFGVIVAGPHGGAVIAQGTLRYGEIAVTMQRLRALAPTPADAARPTVELEDAVRSAMASLATPARSQAPSGTGLVWIVTPGLGATDAGLERVAHVGALGGIATSVLAVGDAGDPSTVESVVLAGQGRRVRVGAAADAERVVRSELEAGGNVVARAVRLRIRLAPGVQLVDILGSRRLDAEATARVREAERAADVRLARELGITQDRGKDEDGVQIVVPTFYADDAHVILLDLVVPGPGPVAEVTARYKDLVRLRNATASESFSLARGAHVRGPLERNVVENYVARELATVLGLAGDRVARGATGEAAVLLRAFASNLASVGVAYPELAGDARIAADAELALGFARVLEEPSAPGAAPILADSLRLASYRRLLRPGLTQSP